VVDFGADRWSRGYQQARFDQRHWTGIIELFRELFRRAPGDETNLARDETISRFGADIRKQPLVNNCQRNGGRRRRPKPETVKMRTFSFILALAFVVAVPSIAGSSDASLPGIGTFAYSGSPVAASAGETVVVAAR
jgi:hypothetical protein